MLQCKNSTISGPADNPPFRSARSWRRRLGVVVAATTIACAAARAPAAGDAVPEPDGYRLEAYRTAVPPTIAGGTVLTTAGLQQLLKREAAILVDVLPHAPKPAGLAPGTLWIEPPRNDIAGSVWLPETGRGALSPAVEAYFKDNLARLTGGDRDRALAFYCLARCWMSWNAAKRAISYGYRRVYWYPDGTDGWLAVGLPTQRAEPAPMP
jgi:PQQ-dependent catabolism-associated CXXCW motif protein